MAARWQHAVRRRRAKPEDTHHSNKYYQEATARKFRADKVELVTVNPSLLLGIPKKPVPPSVAGAHVSTARLLANPPRRTP